MRAVQSRGALRVVGDVAVRGDRRPVVGREEVAELARRRRIGRRAASASPHAARVTESPNSERTCVLVAPQRAGRRAGRRRRDERLHRREQLPDESARRPVDERDASARAGDPNQLVGHRLVKRREHDADARQHDIELVIGEGQVLRVGFLPGRCPGPVPRHAPGRSRRSSGVRSVAITRAPATAAGRLAFPEPAATSRTCSPGSDAGRIDERRRASAMTSVAIRS